jgi:hypothetical protein
VVIDVFVRLVIGGTGKPCTCKAVIGGVII